MWRGRTAALGGGGRAPSAAEFGSPGASAESVSLLTVLFQSGDTHSGFSDLQNCEIIIRVV